MHWNAIEIETAVEEILKEIATLVRFTFCRSLVKLGKQEGTLSRDILAMPAISFFCFGQTPGLSLIDSSGISRCEHPLDLKGFLYNSSCLILILGQVKRVPIRSDGDDMPNDFLIVSGTVQFL